MESFSIKIQLRFLLRAASPTTPLPAIAKWEKSCGKHPTQKPLPLLARIILASTKENDWGQKFNVPTQKSVITLRVSKYLRDDEPPTSTENNLIIWCIKEATYKLFSEDMLSFSEMKVSLVDNEYALVTNLKRMSCHKAYFKITDNYTLAYIY